MPRSKIVYLILIISLLESVESMKHFLPKKNDHIPMRVSTQFRNHQIMLHYDNATFPDLDLFFNKTIDSYQTVLSINYDTNWSHIKRPSGYRYIHIVYLHNPFKFSLFAKFYHNLEHWDVILFTVKRALQKKFRDLKESNICKDEYYDRAGAVFLYDFDFEKGYFCHFYKGNLSGVLQNIGDIKTDNHLIRYVNDFKDFNGHLFTVGFVPYPPYAFCRNDISTNECDPQGIEGNFLKVLSKYLNFRFRMKSFAGQQPGPWQVMVNNVSKHLIDFAIGSITRSQPRAKIVDFTAFLKIDGYSVLFAKSNNNLDKWQDVLRPFSVEVWIYFLLIILLYPLILEKISKRLLSGANTNSYIDYFFLIYETVIEQSIANIPISRLLLFSWMISVIIMTTVYKTKLTAVMISPSTLEPNNMRNLLLLNYFFQVDNEEWSVLRRNLMDMSDPMYKEILKRIRSNLPNCDALSLIFGNKVAMIDETTSLLFQALSKCTYLESKHDFNKLRFTKSMLFGVTHAWPFQKNSPYVWKFSKTILNLHATGQISLWYQSAFKTTIFKSNQRPTDHNFAPLTVTMFMAPGMLYFIGVIVSILIFICECLYKAYKENTLFKTVY